jgi:NADH-quinone oxidoreductase subunit N
VNAQLTLALLPDLIVGAGALLLLLWSAGRRDDDVAASRTAALVAAGVCAAALAAVGALAWRGTADLVTQTSPIAADQFRWAADAVILVGTALSALLAGDFGRRERPVSGEALALMLLSASGMMLLAGARDLVLVFLGVELTSIPVYVLAGLDRRSARSAEAALKYFLLGAFSTAFLLYGVALVYGATGSTQLARIGAQLANPGPLPRVVFSLGVGLTLVGFAFKVAAAPFHMWTPDVYEGAPTPFTAFMAAAVKAGGFAAFARVFLEAFGPVAERWHPVLWWIAAVTMVGGNVVALAQRNVKRMLAYSSIAHAGYLLVALVSNTGRGASAIVFYLFAYTLATVGAFAVVEAVGGSNAGAPDIDRWSGLFSVRPRLAAAMAVFMLALLGFPLAGGMGFFAKWYVLQAALGAPAPQTRLAVILVLASVVSAGYYLYLVAAMFMRRRPDDAPALPPTPAWTGRVVAACAVVLLVLGLYPTPAVRWSQSAALVPGGATPVPVFGPRPGRSAALAPAAPTAGAAPAAP